MTYQQFEKEKYNVTFELDTAKRRLDRLIKRDAKRGLHFYREHSTGFLSRVHKSSVKRHEKIQAPKEDQNGGASRPPSASRKRGSRRSRRSTGNTTTTWSS
jgi:hypothetical protein